jgi:hypothetical protein
MSELPEIIRVEPAPDPETETILPYYQAMADWFEAHVHHRPSRETLRNYKDHGYPVRRHGPYVMPPIYYALHRPMTTVESLERFRKTIAGVQKSLSSRTGAVLSR